MDGTELASLTGLGGVGKWVHAEAQRRKEAYHSPPASLIAFSKARLGGVRFVPELRGMSGSASSARRLANAALKAGKSTRRPVHARAVPCGSVFKRFNAIFTHRFCTDATLKIHAVQRRVKSVNSLRACPSVSAAVPDAHCPMRSAIRFSPQITTMACANDDHTATVATKGYWLLSDTLYRLGLSNGTMKVVRGKINDRQACEFAPFKNVEKSQYIALQKPRLTICSWRKVDLLGGI